MGDQEKDPFVLAVTPEIESLTGEIVSRFTQALLSLGAERFGSLKELAQKVGCSATYLYKIQNEERKLSFGLIARLISVLGVTLEAFLRRLLELEWAGKKGIDQELTGSPVVLLNQWREPGAEKDSPFLKSLGESLAEIGTFEPLVLPASSAWRSLLLVLEEERLRDWRKTRRRLERYILRLVRRHAAEGRVSRMELADLATLLAAWSAVQRVAGLRGFAIDGLTLAFELAERSKDVWADGFCLQKAAYLSHDLGRDGMAAAMIRKAAVCFSEVGTPEDLARLAIDRGYFSYYCGRLDEAQRLLERGLRTLEPNQRLYRASAHLALARIRREKGDLAGARRELDGAIKCHAPSSIEAAYTSWEAACLATQFEAMERAKAYFVEALQTFAKYGRAGDLAFVALDYAELLLKTGPKSELNVLIKDVLGWLTPLALSNVCLLKPFENLSALLAMGSVQLAELNNTRADCKKAMARLMTV